MRRRFLIIALLLTSAMVSARNLVDNWSFENGLEGWFIAPGRHDTGTYTADTVEKFWGTASLKMVVTNGDVILRKNQIPVEAETKYYFSCWAKVDDDPRVHGSNGALFITINNYKIVDGKATPLGTDMHAWFTDNVTAKLGEWVYCTYVFTTPAETETMNISLRLRPTRACGWFDNIYLGTEPEPLVQNMGNTSYMVPKDENMFTLPLIVNPLPVGTTLKYQLKEKHSGEIIKEEDLVGGPGVVNLELDLKELELKNYLLSISQFAGGDKEDLISIDLKMWDPDDKEPPEPPANIKTDVSPGRVTLSWEVPNFNPHDEDLPDEYFVYRSDQSGFDPTQSKPIKELPGIETVGAPMSFTDYLLGGKYYYRIGASDLAGNFAYSDEIAVELEGIAAPVLSEDNKNIFVDEKPNFSWGYLSGVTNYKIELARDESFSNNVIEQSVHASNTTFTFEEKLETGVWYLRLMAEFDEAFSEFSAPFRFTYLLSEEGSSEISYLIIKPEIYNPLAGDLEIEVVLNDDSQIALDLYTATGRKIAQVFTGQRPKGANIITWNGAEASRTLGNGAYILKMTLDNGIQPTVAYKKFLIWYQ